MRGAIYNYTIDKTHDHLPSIGSSAAVYGIFTWSNLGLIELAFTLDGESLSQTYRVDADTPQFVSELDQQQNFLFYSYDFLPAGDHTLIVNLTACVNQTLAFDYVTYTPSFATLASMPNLTLADATSMQMTMSKNSHLGIIAAGLGGAIILLLLGGIIFLCRRRRRTKENFMLGESGSIFSTPSQNIFLKPCIAFPYKHDRPSIRHIPLMSPPSTASSYNDCGTMAFLQSTGGPEYDLLHRQTDETLAPLQPVRRLPLPGSSVGNDGADTAPLMSLHRMTAPVMQRGVSQYIYPHSVSEIADASSSVPSERRDRFSEWDVGSEAGETSPPSYDETTRGRPQPWIIFEQQKHIHRS